MVNVNIAARWSFYCLLISCGCKQQPVFSQKIKSFDLVKDFKAVPDDRTDNYAAFKNAAETISAAGGGILNIPKGNYYIASYKNNGAAITDVLFRNCKSLTITGNNSRVRVNGKFTRKKDYRLPGLPYHYAGNNTVCPFKFSNCKNVLMKDLELYGEVDKMTKEEGVVEGENYGVFISDDDDEQESSNILFKNITAHHFAADGFLVKSNGKNIKLDGCRSNSNARQGLSIVKGNEIDVLNSTFDSTGNTGKYGWHAPGAGIDVENEFGAGKLNNVRIKNCSIRGNKGFQIVTTLASQNVLIDSCFIADLTSGYSDALNGVGVFSLHSTISNNIIFAGIQVDLSDQIYTGPAVQYITNNLIYSGNRGIVSADFSRPVQITGNILVMLPNPDLNTYFPYIQNTNCIFNNNLVAVHADRLKKDPNQVTALVQSAREAKNDFWLINGFTIPPEKQKSTYYIPAVNGTAIVENQFFSPSDLTTRFAIPEKNILSQKQVTELLTKKLFTSFKQTAFTKNMLIEANTVRRYANSLVTAANRK